MNIKPVKQAYITFMSSQKTRHQKLVPGGGGGGGQLCPHIERMKYKHACTIKIRSPQGKNIRAKSTRTYWYQTMKWKKVKHPKS